MTFVTGSARHTLAVLTAETRTTWRNLEGDRDPAAASSAGFNDEVTSVPVGFLSGGLSSDWSADMAAALERALARAEAAQ